MFLGTFAWDNAEKSTVLLEKALSAAVRDLGLAHSATTVGSISAADDPSVGLHTDVDELL